MWMKAALSLIKNHLPATIFAVIIAALTGVVGWNIGWRNGAGELQTVQSENANLHKQVIKFERQNREAAENYAQALNAERQKQRAQQARADAATLAWHKTQAELESLRRKQKQRVNDAVKNDTTRYSGIGPFSLREYRSSLGYDTTPRGDGVLPENSTIAVDHTGETSGPGAGLQPEDLLSHAADYGAWCLKLENQIKAIGSWSEGEQ